MIKITEIPIYDKLYPIRERAFLSLDDTTKYLLDASIQGSGKSIASFKLAVKYNKTTIGFFDNHDKAMEIYDEAKTYFNANISYMVARTYKCDVKQQQAISEILGIDFKDDYVCNMCNKDEKVLELYNKGYVEREFCWNCEERNTCVYYGLKEHSLKKRQFKENRLIILVKAYLNTTYFNEDLLETHDNYGLIIDEGILEVMTRQVNFSRKYFSNKTCLDWIKMVDWLVNEINLPEGIITTIWVELKNLLQTILDYKLTVEERETLIGDILVKLYDNYMMEDFLQWNEILKTNIYYYYYDELENVISNQFYSLQLILKDLYDIDDYDEVRRSIFISSQNKEFTYVISCKHKLEYIMHNSKNTLIPASNLDKKLFEELMPEFEDRFIYINPDITHQYKVVYQTRHNQWIKSTLYNPITYKDKITGKYRDKYQPPYYNLLKTLRVILNREIDKKVLIVAQGDISKKLKRDLKGILEKRDDLTTNIISIEYYYNLEGKNKYQHYNVVVLFGGAGIPSKLLKILSKKLGVSLSRLEHYYVSQQHIQCIERLRSVLYPYQKVVYSLTSIDLPVPKEQILKFNSIKELILLDKIKEQGATSEKECLAIYNQIYDKNIKQWQMNSILSRMEKNDILKSYTHKTGAKGRPPRYYTIPIDNLI